MKNIASRFIKTVAFGAMSALFLAGCGGGGGDAAVAAAATGVTLSGTVTTSAGSVSSKPQQILSKMSSAPMGKVGSKQYKASRKAQLNKSSSLDTTGGSNGTGLPLFAVGDVVTDAAVFLYNADHPEWLYPVASDTTGSAGEYSMSVLENAANNDNAYTDGGEIPAGNYTVLAFKPGGYDPTTGQTTDPIVAVQQVVQELSGTVTGDMVAQSSEVTPNVELMFGRDKNRDGTTTWGASDGSVTLPDNANVQIAFDMAMGRGTGNYIVLSGTTSGTISCDWKMSSDWLTASCDPTTDFVDGETITVTVSTTASNVYSNSMGYDAVGEFIVVPSDTTAPVATVTPADAATGVLTYDPIRIVSNEELDVNALLLQATPSVGAKPGILFLGDGGSYTYEFVLGESLQAGETYTWTVSGIQDLAGNAATDQTGSFSVEASVSAFDTDGTTADATASSDQEDVVAVFGKWIRAFNDRSITQLKNMMTGDFIFEEQMQPGDINEDDLNSDGRLDLAEFTAMIENAYQYWDMCGATMAGEILESTDEGVDGLLGTADDTTYFINVVGGAAADFKFRLTATTTDTSQDCSDVAPDADMFANAVNINGQWYLSRMSEGRDTRDTALVTHGKVEILSETANATYDATCLDDGDASDCIPTGASPDHGSVLTTNPAPSVLLSQLDQPYTVTDKVTFEWEAYDGAASYLLLIKNATDEWRGRAFVVPATVTSASWPFDFTDTDNNGFGDKYELPAGGIAALKLFWESKEKMMAFADGETFEWEVMALGSVVPGDLDTDGNGIYQPDTDSSRVGAITDDIIAVSKVYRYTNAGIKKEILLAVENTTGANIGPVTFDEWIWGYGTTEDTVDVTITVPSAPVHGQIWINGGNSQQIVLVDQAASIDLFAGGTTATVTIPLSTGWNWIDINLDMGDDLYLWKNFNIETSGGSPAAISMTAIKDSNNLDLSACMDSWGYINSLDSCTTTITGSATGIDRVVVTFTANTDAFADALLNNTMSWAQAGLWNETVGAWVDAGDTVTPIDIGNGMPDGVAPDSYTITFDLYDGNNWIDMMVGLVDGSQASGHMGVYTENGMVYTPPIEITDVVDAALMSDFGNSSDWDASGDADDIANITGSVSDASLNYRYSVSSDGAWMEDSLVVQADGSFSINVDLYNGWNWISIYDENWNNWYGVNVYTDQGQVIIRPEVAAVYDAAVSATPVTPDMYGEYTIGSCNAHVQVTAPAGTELEVSLNGDDYSGGYSWDYFYVTTDVNGEASFNVPVLGSVNGSYNWVNIFDVSTYNGSGFSIKTTDTSCAYVAPVMNFDPITGDPAITGVLENSDGLAGGTAVTVDMYGSMTLLDASTDLVFYGTHSQPNRPIKVGIHGCSQDKVDTLSSETADGNGEYPWVAIVPVYQDYVYYDLSDGFNWFNLSSYSATGAVMTPSMTVSSVGTVTTPSYSDCSYSSWVLTTETTATIAGTALQEGVGYYYAGGTSGEFVINADGTWSVDVDLFDGSNYVDIYDANWNWIYIDIQTSNFVTAPRYVDITNPVVASQGSAATMTGTVVTGSLDASFTPDIVHANVSIYDGASWTDTYYSSDQWDQDNYGDLPIILNGDGTFSFDTSTTGLATFFDNSAAAGSYAYMSVNADDWTNGTYHGASIDLYDDDMDYSYFWKPGMKVTSQQSLKSKAKENAARRHKTRIGNEWRKH